MGGTFYAHCQRKILENKKHKEALLEQERKYKEQVRINLIENFIHKFMTEVHNALEKDEARMDTPEQMGALTSLRLSSIPIKYNEYYIDVHSEYLKYSYNPYLFTEEKIKIRFPYDGQAVYEKIIEMHGNALDKLKISPVYCLEGGFIRLYCL